MGVPRSIRLRFAAKAAAPVALLVLAWGALTAALLSGGIHRLSGLSSQSRAALITGAGAIALVAGVIIMTVFARSLARELTGLAQAAAKIADGQDAEVTTRTKEIADAAQAIALMQRRAAEAAATESRLRDGLRQILISLGKRNQSLLHRQLRILDELEKQAASPQALGDLFALDHLTTRMRRHAESLTIVAGSTPARSGNEAVPVVDVIRAAAAEVEDYKRVTVITDAEEAVAATAVTDMIHLLAELIENATLFSPSSTRVEVKAEAVANGFAIEVEDRGLGIEPGQLAAINSNLENPPDFDLADADRLGLFVVARLAARHGVQVSLGPSPYRGTKAVVLLPDAIVVEHVEPRWSQESAARPRVALSLATVGAGAPAPAPVTEDETPAEPSPVPAEGGRTLHGLPRRVRPETMPQRVAAKAAKAAKPPESPAPEHARNLATSLQTGWQRARHNPESEDDLDGRHGRPRLATR